ncbi:MAG: tRNA (adenosine(37)-N6)-threonylcarbamoyltransferase complex dimerization subunit type 1 TsaB [Candidatus Omnitrophica bacterium]|nr:tRNA (adenosine(37)-N6)-threonylcarbamoyltransferase complex dimerization subunit type 1 TsaB [Candidatus Omnitrophota bacterium]
MKILAVDTSTSYLCIGVYDNLKVYEYTFEVGRQLSAVITVSIKRVLDALGLKVEDIDYFACGLGPGSFTGMRVGLAALKGLSWSVKKPMVGVPSLDILAKNCLKESLSIVPIIDAKRSLIYTSVFRKNKAGLVKTKPYLLLNEDELFKLIKPRSIVLGDAVNLYKDKLIAQVKGVVILDKEYWYPKPRNIIELALERIKNKKLDNCFELSPIYLYPKECQVRRK